MAYSYTITGNGNQTSEIVYSGKHRVIDTSSSFVNQIRNNIPRYSEIVSATVSGEMEKGYSWATAYAWFENLKNGSRAGEKHKLSNGTTSNLTAAVAGFFYSKAYQSGEFDTSSSNGIDFAFDVGAVPVTFVSRNKKVTYSFNKPTIALKAYLSASTGGHLEYGGSNVGTESSKTYEVNISSQSHAVTAVPDTGYECVGWSHGSGLSIGTISGNTLTFKFNDTSINNFSTSSQYYTSFRKKKYTITYKNYDGSTLTTKTVEHGDQIGTVSISPTRPYDATYHYVFSGWDKASTTVATGNITVTAQYSSIAHIYDMSMTAEGRRKYVCSSCQRTYYERPYDLCLENIFHFSDWAETSGPTTVYNGSATYNIPNGTVTITGNGDCFTNYGFSSNCYLMSVTPGEEYIFSYNLITTNGQQAYVFFYDDNGNGITAINGSGPWVGTYDGSPLIFTVPPGATKIGIRIGTTGTGGSATFSNLIICKTKHYPILTTSTTPTRYTFFKNEAANILTPNRRGFDFKGCFSSEALTSQVSFPLNLSQSITVYTKWFERLIHFFKDPIFFGYLGQKKIQAFLGKNKLL